jgi:type II secretory pathway component PulM
MKQRIRSAIAGIDKLNPRDRMALAGGLLAALVGIEAMIVMPMKTKRQQIEQAVLAESSSQSDAQQAVLTERASRLADLRTRSDEMEAKLASLGLKQTQRDSLNVFLTRALHDQGVKVTSVRGLPLETLAIEVVGVIPGADAAASAPAASASEATPNVTLFRHRAELKLEGQLPGLMRVVDMLERDLAPLRIERVSLGSAPGAGAARVVVVLTTISQERTWLVL